MASGQDVLNYEKLIRGYKNGRIPAGIWLLSCLCGGITLIVANLYFHNPVLRKFFSVFIGNLIATLPIFTIQAHFVALALQKKPQSAFRTMLIILVSCWTVYAVIVIWIIDAISFVHTPKNLLGAAIYCSTVTIPWVVLSVVSFRKNLTLQSADA